MCADLQVGRVNGNVLGSQALLYHATHLVFGDRRQRCVVAVEKRETNIFVAYKERRTRSFRIPFAEAEDTFVRALARDDLLKTETEILALVALDIELPVFS